MARGSCRQRGTHRTRHAQNAPSARRFHLLAYLTTPCTRSGAGCLFPEPPGSIGAHAASRLRVPRTLQNQVHTNNTHTHTHTHTHLQQLQPIKARFRKLVACDAAARMGWDRVRRLRQAVSLLLLQHQPVLRVASVCTQSSPGAQYTGFVAPNASVCVHVRGRGRACVQNGVHACVRRWHDRRCGPLCCMSNCTAARAKASSQLRSADERTWCARAVSSESRSSISRSSPRVVRSTM